MTKTIIIGKNSNLSNAIAKEVENSFLISSRDVIENIDILSSFKHDTINLILNNFQPAIKINELDSTTEYISNSIFTTAKILDYFKNTKINKIIYSSSSSVYGNNILCKEDDELKPLNLHASLKIANEKLIEKYVLLNNVDFTIARVFNVFGGNDNFSIISKIINAYQNDEEITIVNHGNAIRDFIHIDDIAQIYKKLLNTHNVNILNIGSGNGYSIKNILDFLHNHNIHVKTKNIFREEIKISTADVRLLDELFEKNSFISVEEYLVDKLKLIN